MINPIDLDSVELTRNECFVTRIYEIQLATGGALDALNASIVSSVFALRAQGEQGLDYAGAGWQTPHDLHTRGDFAPLFDAIGAVLKELSKAEDIPDEYAPVVHRAWSNVERKGDFVRNHVHPWSVWSGVYYAQVDERSGDLFFEDPRPAHKALAWPHAKGENRGLVQFRPRPGMLVVFPSWLEHYTDPSRSENERVCVAFNASLGTPPTLALSR